MEMKTLTVQHYVDALQFHKTDYQAVDDELICRLAGMSQAALDELPYAEGRPFEDELVRQITPHPHRVDAEGRIHRCDCPCECGGCLVERECGEECQCATEDRYVATLPAVFTMGMKRRAKNDTVRLVALACDAGDGIKSWPLQRFKTAEYAVRRRFLAPPSSTPIPTP